MIPTAGTGATSILERPTRVRPGTFTAGCRRWSWITCWGEAASPDGKPRFTGSITVRYPRACPLGGALHAEAQITRVDGVKKTFVSGYISDAEGITVEADGVFITPRWLRD